MRVTANSALGARLPLVDAGMRSLLRIAIAAVAVASAPLTDAMPPARRAASEEFVPLSRVIASSERLALTGTFDRDAMTVQLEHVLTREPVIGARIEVELTPLGDSDLQSVQRRAEPLSDGMYTFRNLIPATPGQYAVSFFVEAGVDSDVLTSLLSVTTTTTAGSHRKQQLFLALVAATALLLVVIVASRWARRYR